MIFSKTKLSDACIIEIEKFEDERGFFARIWDKEKFLENGINDEFLQHSISLSKKKGTIRGIHYQIKPFEESKLIRCTRGSVYSVLVDLRPNSPTYKQWESTILSQNEYNWRHIPEGCANGIQTLDDDTEIIYQVSQYYSQEHEGGIRWNDPTFNIDWSITVESISKKDDSWPDFM